MAMFTIGLLWWLPVLALLLVLGVWYWTLRVSHRAVERISQENPRLYNFRFRAEERRRDRR